MSHADLALIAVLMFGLYFRAFAEGAFHLGFEIIKGCFSLITVLLTRGHRPLLTLAVKLGLLSATTTTESEKASTQRLTHLPSPTRAFATERSVQGDYRSAEWIYHTHNSID